MYVVIGNGSWDKKSFQPLERLDPFERLELIKQLKRFYKYCYIPPGGAADVPVTPAVSVKRMASSMFISRGRTALCGTSTA